MQITPLRLVFAMSCAFAVILVSNNVIASTLECYTVKDHVYAPDRQTLELVSQLVADGDRAAFKNLLADGRIGIFKGRTRVYRVSSAGFLWSLKQIRIPGTTVTIWTFSEGIDCKRP